MKLLLLLSSFVCTATAVMAQNTAVINQQGGSGHGASVTQQGSGNTSVVSQSGNHAVISQSGSGNVSTISQGSNAPGAPGQSVSVTQSGGGETHIDQTDGNGNHIVINQTGEPAPTPADIKARKRLKRRGGKSAN